MSTTPSNSFQFVDLYSCLHITVLTSCATLTKIRNKETTKTIGLPHPMENDNKTKNKQK